MTRIQLRSCGNGNVLSQPSLFHRVWLWRGRSEPSSTWVGSDITTPKKKLGFGSWFGSFANLFGNLEETY